MSPDQSSDVGSGISDNDTCMLSFEAIKSLEEVSAYKYLGVLEADDLKHNKMKEEIRKEYLACCCKVLKNHAYALNKTDTINMYASTVVTCSASIVN